MNFAVTVLGHTAVERLQTATGEHVLLVGADKFTRGDLARIGCYNYIAARNLSAALQAFDVKDLRDLFERISPRDLALPRIGVIALAVLGAAFELKNIGSANPLEAYVRKHQPKLCTFDTMKTQRRNEKQRRRRERQSHLKKQQRSTR
jgi:hypothetical protein